jgi:FKBP-type peptidyl-prolyl cis-trans isomerase (trigger factor)
MEAEEITEDFVLDETNFTSVEELLGAVEEFILHGDGQQDFGILQRNMFAAFNAAFEAAEIIAFPEGAKDFHLREVEEIAQQYELTLEELLAEEQMSMEDFEEYLETMARRDLFVFALAAQEGFSVTQDDVDEWFAEIRLEVPEDMTDEDIYERMGGTDAIVRNLTRERAMEFILEHAVAVPPSEESHAHSPDCGDDC